MAMQVIDHLYPTYEEAVEVVADLTRAGLPPDAISLIESDADARLPREVNLDAATNPVTSLATLGAAVGAGLGGLDGVGAIVIPFTQPLVQTGWIPPTLVFAAAGGVLGALAGLVSGLGSRRNRRAELLANGLQRGEHLVLAQVDPKWAAEALAIMNAPRRPGRLPDPAYDLEPVVDQRDAAQEKAAIHREERNLDYQSE